MEDLGYVFFIILNITFKTFLKFLNFGKGGMSFHGGLLGSDNSNNHFFSKNKK